MPTISVPRTITQALGRKYALEEFSDLLFDFGLEVDEVTESAIKIEIPANRYDLLCANGLVQSLQSYLGIKEYEDLKTSNSELQVISNCSSRPFIACAVIENFTFDQESYDQFIDYQEKLNLSIGNGRSLASIGTHDFDKITFPVLYTELPPSEISFQPFNSDLTLRGESIHQFLKSTPLVKYCKLLNNKSYPVVLSGENILSLPPIINSRFSKISLDTKNIFIEVTGTDFNKVNTTLKLILYNFKGSGVICVKVNEKITPIFDNLSFHVSLSEINTELGLSLKKEDAMEHLKRMMYHPSCINLSDGISLTSLTLDGTEDANLGNDRLQLGGGYAEEGCHHVEEGHLDTSQLIRVDVPDVRSDVLHKIDIIEDIAISYGFNNFRRTLPPTLSIGSVLPLNDFSEKLKTECCILGFLEMVGLLLGPRISSAQLKVLHSKSSENQSLRFSILPGLLRATSSNQHASLPIKLFELGDVFEGAIKKKTLCCIIAGKIAKIEEIQGVLTRILRKCNISNYEYFGEEHDFYQDGRSGIASVCGERIARFGIISNKVCEGYKVPFECTSLEIDVDMVFDIFKGSSN